MANINCIFSSSFSLSLSLSSDLVNLLPEGVVLGLSQDWQWNGNSMFLVFNDMIKRNKNINLYINHMSALAESCYKIYHLYWEMQFNKLQYNCIFAMILWHLELFKIIKTTRKIFILTMWKITNDLRILKIQFRLSEFRNKLKSTIYIFSLRFGPGESVDQGKVVEELGTKGLWTKMGF